MDRMQPMLLALLLTGCATQVDLMAPRPPAMAESEALAGAAAAREFEPRFGGVFRDEDAESRLHDIADALRPGRAQRAIHYRIRLLASDRLNAASLPVRRIYITRGLYDVLSDAQLAAVIAHEMGHLDARDSFQPRCATLEESLARELAADARAVEILRRSGLPGRAMADVVELIASIQPADWVQLRVDAIDEAITRSSITGD